MGSEFFEKYATLSDKKDLSVFFESQKLSFQSCWFNGTVVQISRNDLQDYDYGCLKTVLRAKEGIALKHDILHNLGFLMRRMDQGLVEVLMRPDLENNKIKVYFCFSLHMICFVSRQKCDRVNVDGDEDGNMQYLIGENKIESNNSDFKKKIPGVEMEQIQERFEIEKAFEKLEILENSKTKKRILGENLKMEKSGKEIMNFNEESLSSFWDEFMD